MIQIPARLRRRPGRMLLLVLALGCGHQDSFDHQEPTEPDPFETVEPIQLTRSEGQDQFPAWRADGSGLLYSYVDYHGDWCIGEMPPGGGQVSRFHCPNGDPANDSLSLAIEAAPQAGEVTAWVEQQNVRDRQVLDRGAIMYGRLGSPTPTRLLALPYRATTGTIHLTAAYLRWLPRNRLAYIGTDHLIRAICFGCKPDTVVIGREVMLLDASSPGSVPVLVPGTEQATGLWPMPDSTGVYYTVAGDTRVWRREFEADLPSIVHDFGLAGIPRDVSVVGNRLAAIVGGNVSYGWEESIGWRQVDSGGTIMTVDLTTGTEVTHPGLGRYRRAVLSPDGHSIVVEGLLGGQTHPDLYLFRLPP
jgi:hypothetical protein